jgi:hypothetical protein
LGVEILVLTDTKFPVWHPYYGTWFIAILVELVLLTVRNVSRHPKSVYDFTFVAIQGLRLSAFILLPSIYFGLCSDKKEYKNSDPERQSLIRKKNLSNASASESVANSNSYDTTSDTSTNISDTIDDSDASSEDLWLREERKAEELILKRLKQGSWFTYVKGFGVSQI